MATVTVGSTEYKTANVKWSGSKKGTVHLVAKYDTFRNTGEFFADGRTLCGRFTNNAEWEVVDGECVCKSCMIELRQREKYGSMVVRG